MRTVKLNDTPSNMRLMRQRINYNRAHPTPAEAHVLSLLPEVDIECVFQKGIFTAFRFFIVDFYFPKPFKLCLEVDGGYHTRQTAYDRERDNFIRTKRKMRVLRITNEHAFSLTSRQLAELIR